MTKTHPYQKHTSSADYFQNLDISQMVENEPDQIKCLNYLKILTPGRECEEITQFCRHYGKLVRYINYVWCGPREINKPWWCRVMREARGMSYLSCYGAGFPLIANLGTVCHNVRLSFLVIVNHLDQWLICNYTTYYQRILRLQHARKQGEAFLKSPTLITYFWLFLRSHHQEKLIQCGALTVHLCYSSLRGVKMLQCLNLKRRVLHCEQLCFKAGSHQGMFSETSGSI